MKKQVFCLRTLLAVAMCVLMSATFTSCKDDDDDENDETTTKNELLLVGEWSRDESGSNSYYHWVFLEDGTGYDKVFIGGGDYYLIDGTFTWSVNSSKLSINWEEFKELYTIISITSKELIVYDPDIDDYRIFTRVK